MCDRRVLEALGHDSLVDLAIRQQEVIQDLDAAVAGLKAEKEAHAWPLTTPQRLVLPELTEEQIRDALRTTPHRPWVSPGEGLRVGYADGVDPTDAMRESWERYQREHPDLDLGLTTGADTGQETAPPDDQTGDQEPVGRDDDDTTTEEEGAGRSDVPHISDSRQQMPPHILGMDPGGAMPDKVIDQGEDVWVRVTRMGEDRYELEDRGVNPSWPLAVVAAEWGPLRVVEQ